MNTAYKDSGDHPGVNMIKIIYSFCNSKKAFRFIKWVASVPFILRWVHLLELTVCHFDKTHFLSFIYMKKNPDYYKHFYSHQKHFYFASISLLFPLLLNHNCWEGCWHVAQPSRPLLLNQWGFHSCTGMWGLPPVAQGHGTLRITLGPSKLKPSAPGESRRAAGSGVPELLCPSFPVHMWGDHPSCPTMSTDDRRWETDTEVSAGSQEEEQEPTAPSSCWTAAPVSAGHWCSWAGAAGVVLLAGDASLSSPWETQHLSAECCAAGTGPGLTSGETEETRNSFSKWELALVGPGKNMVIWMLGISCRAELQQNRTWPWHTATGATAWQQSGIWPCSVIHSSPWGMFWASFSYSAHSILVHSCLSVKTLPSVTWDVT